MTNNEIRAHINSRNKLAEENLEMAKIRFREGNRAMASSYLKTYYMYVGISKGWKELLAKREKCVLVKQI